MAFAPSLFNGPVQKELVHKLAISEVFPTGIEQISDARLVVGVTWPRRHAFFGSLVRGIDSHLIIETARQIVLLISHEVYAVPIGWPFLFIALEATFADQYPAWVDDDVNQLTRSTVQIHVHGQPDTRRKTRVILEFTQQEIVFARVSIDFIVSNQVRERPMVWDASLAGYPSTSRRGLIPAGDLNLTDPSDVVLRQENGDSQFLLSLDLKNPFLFDHPVDHVPGMAMIEACRQACRLTSRRRSDPSHIEIRFRRMLGLINDTYVHCEVASDGLREVSFVQENLVCAKARITIEPDLVRRSLVPSVLDNRDGVNRNPVDQK